MSDFDEKTKKTRETRFQVSDRRFWVDRESDDDEVSDLEPKYPSFVEELKARTEAAEEKLKERLQQLEEENASFRERMNKHLETRLEEERATFLATLLEVIDNFERALAAAEQSSFDSLLQGMELNLDLFLKRLKEVGVEPIDNLRKPFDPNEAEALSVVDVSEPELDDKVVEVLQKGYRLGERVIRPAIVHVGRWQTQDR